MTSHPPSQSAVRRPATRRSTARPSSAPPLIPTSAPSIQAPPTRGKGTLLSSPIFPDNLSLLDINPAQEWYLRCVAQEAVRLTLAMLDVQQRQQERSALMLTAELRFRPYIISLIQLDQDEYSFLCQQQAALKASVWTTISSWQYRPF